jgi:hypothetical protein
MDRIDAFVRRWVDSRGRWFHSVVVVTLLGVIFVAAPRPMLALFGAEASPTADLLARMFGAASVNVGLVHGWFHGGGDARAGRGLLISNAVFEGIVAAVLAHATASHVLGPIAWGLVAYFAWETVWNAFAFWRLSASR